MKSCLIGLMAATVVVITPAMITPAMAQQSAASPAAIGAVAPATAGDQPGPNVERRITELKQKLAITPAQEPQWTSFAGAMRQNAVHMAQLGAGRASVAGKQKAPDEMRGYSEVARAHAEDLARLIAPFDALYAVMSPEQQMSADRTFNRPAPGMGRRR